MSGTSSGGAITVSVPLDGAKAAPVDPNAKPVDAAAVVAEAPKEGAGPATEVAAPVNPNELTPKPVEQPVAGKTEEQQRAEAATGLDLAPFSAEFQRDGKLSDASYKALEAKGFTKQIADTYIAGVQAQVTARLTDLSSAVGGVDSYNAIMEWGKSGLSEGEKAEAVRTLSGGTSDSAKTYLMGLQARFVAANGKVPGKIAGGGSQPSEDIFASRTDQAKAMRDPRYKSDAKYRDEVTQKSIRSFGGKNATVKTRKRTPVKKAASRRPRLKSRNATTTHRTRSKGKR